MHRFCYGYDLNDCHNWNLVGHPGWMVYGDDMYVTDDYMDELWMPIIGFENEYWVSDYGRVYSLISNRFLKPQRDTSGHLQVRLGSKLYFVHRLMAEAFIPRPRKGSIVRHLDDNPDNNVVDNLEWGTQLDNMRDAVRNDSYKHVQTKIKATNKKTGESMYFDSQHEAARYFELSQGNINHALNRKHGSCGGWLFEYVNGRRGETWMY